MTVRTTTIPAYSIDGLDRLDFDHAVYEVSDIPGRTIRRLRRALEESGAWTITTTDPYGLRTLATADTRRIIADHLEGTA